MKEADLKLRDTLIKEGRLFEGYDKEMEALHIQHADGLNEIIDKIGFPTIDKVGKDANNATWFIIQHAISRPKFMRKCLLLLTDAASRGHADKTHVAYLSDRIAVFEGRLQLHGTQFDWDENEELNPLPYDDLMKVNQRRKELQLNTLEGQTQLMRERAKAENETPPIDYDEKKREYNDWRRRVGWM